MAFGPRFRFGEGAMAQDIPIIDLASYRAGDGAARQAVADAIAQTCETLGFLVVSGHGIPAEDGTALHRTALGFFDLPLDEKLAVRRLKND